MNKFVLLTATFGVPLLGFLMLSDFAGTIYRPSSGPELGYQVVEPEEEEVAEEEPVEEEEVAEVEEAEDAPAEEVEVADAAPVEDAPAESEEVADASDAEVTEEAATEEEAPAPEATPAVEVAALSEDEMAAARRAVRKCAACHQVERERNGVGPHLVGVIGRPIGAVDGFRYSDALAELNAAGEVWTQDNMVEWLEDPSAFAPGTKMNFKLRDEEERRLIAGWLAQNED